MGRQQLPRRSRLVLLVALAAALVVGAARAADAPIVTATQELAGLDNVAGGGFEPPDVQIAAGPGHVVELVNLAERVWRTSRGAAAEQVRTSALADLFGSGGDRLTDPRILYDALSGRWFASISDLDANGVRLAVSAGSDPLGKWTVASFPGPGCADQPRLGVADGTVVLGADIYSNCDEGEASTALGAELWVINKQQLLAGSTAPAYTTYGPDQTEASFAPVQSLSPTPLEYVVSVDTPQSQIAHVFAVDGVPPGAVHVSEVAQAEIDPLNQPPNATQPRLGSGGRLPPIETNDVRVLDSVYENGRIWFSANSACIPTGDSFLRSCARVVELSAATKTVDWDLDLGVADANLFYPAVRPDAAGDVVVVAGESSSSVEPELVALARMSDGTLTAPAVIAQSPGPYLGSRYGDYFGAARDPLDPSVVWVAGETAGEAGERGWTTAVASVVVTAAGGTPPAVTVAAAPRLRALQGAVRVPGGVRVSYRAVDGGDAVRAVVSIRRKGSVIYRRTTTAAPLEAGHVYRLRWPAPKAANGAYTLCVHSRLAAGTQSPESCAPFTLR